MKILPYSAEVWPQVAELLAQEAFCCIDGFLNPEEIKSLRQALQQQQEADRLKKAGVGSTRQFRVNDAVRGDYIKWIEPEEALPPARAFLARVQDLMHQLNRLLFLSLKDFECHYALYPPGSFYEKHVDQFKGSTNRKISFACYLNENWQETHQGCLRVYTPSGESHDIAPLAGRLALFRSDVVPHEVLTTQTLRYSLTGWLRDRPVNLPY